ncbi:MAG: hypothetical protein DRJ43_04460 [Thermoprotei archaeon]|nr:MAG: hypothetical protein DRJ43_04460 [Thermoprotei archaeon]
MARLKVLDSLVWSQCPTPVDIEEAVERGVALVVNLDPSCSGYYKRAEELGVEVVEHPIQPLSFRPVEEVNSLVYRILGVVSVGRRVMVHAGNGDGRCGTFLMMTLTALGVPDPSEVVGSVGGPESLVQEHAVAWYARLLDLLGVEKLYSLYEIGRQYEFGAGLEHASTVANLSLDFAEALKPRVEFDERLLASVYVAGLLHDVGRFFSERRHEEIGVRIVMGSARVLEEVADLNLVVFGVRHHRRHTKPSKDPLLNVVGDEGLHLAAIVRLADAFTNVYGKEEYWGVHLEDESLVVRARFVNKRRFEEKGKLLREVVGVTPTLEHA